MRWLCAAAIAAAGGTGFGSAAAQPKIHHPAAQAQAAVVPLAYRNVFAEAPMGVAEDRVDWKRANEEVGQFTRGHADVLKWEAERGSTGVGAGPVAPVSPSGAAPTPHGAHR